jgi:tRNA1Val (adenine37-N6)-methyltransferase
MNDITLDSIRDIRIYQSKTGYRFSVDALLLFDFVNIKAVKKIADLGAGSGVIGLLLAKKYLKADVFMFEIQNALAELAERNVSLNNLGDRVRVVRADIKGYVSEGLSGSFDVVVSNPPFRKNKSGRLNLEDEKTVARHEIAVCLDDFIRFSRILLRERGRFCMIHHPSRLAEHIRKLQEKGLEPKRVRFVHSNISTEAKMVLMEAVKGGRAGLVVERPFYLYNADGSYTAETMEMYKAGELI